MKRALFSVILIVLLSGCATTQMIKPEKPPVLGSNKDTAQLVIIRDTSFGGVIVFWNYLDGKFIGETVGSSFFVTNVQPGEHYVVSATENTGIAQLNFQAGKQYFLRQGVTVGLWRARTTGFSPVPVEEAKKLIQSCTYLQLDPTKTFPDMEPALYQKAIEDYRFGVKEHYESYKDMLEYKGE